MLDKLISDYSSSYSNKKETVREYIQDLENRITIPHDDNLENYTDKEIFDYIEYLWVICAIQH